MSKGPGKIVRDNKSSSYPVFELTGVNCNIIRDFNVGANDPHMNDFCNDFCNLSSLIKAPPCYKTPETPSCNDLILTNSPFKFSKALVW